MSVAAQRLRSARGRGTDLRVVRRRDRGLIERRGSSRLAGAAVTATLVAGALIFAILLEQVVLAQSAFKLSRIRERLVVEEARHEELLLEAARLDSSARIERYARDVLGMVDPEPVNVRYIVADIGARRAAHPAPGLAYRIRDPQDALAAGGVSP